MTTAERIASYCGKYLAIALIMSAFGGLLWWSWPHPVISTFNGFMAGAAFWRMWLEPVEEER